MSDIFWSLQRAESIWRCKDISAHLSGYALPLSWLGENCFKVLGSFDCKSDVVYSGNYVPQLEDWECCFVSLKAGNNITGYDSYIKEYVKYVL